MSENLNNFGNSFERQSVHSNETKDTFTKPSQFLRNKTPQSTLQLSEVSIIKKEAMEAKRRHEEIQRKFDAKKISIPTSEEEVKRILRENKEVVTYFGESAMERRTRLIFSFRLQKLLENSSNLKFPKPLPRQTKTDQTGTVEGQYFLYEGAPEIKDFRTNLVKYSLQAAALRTEKARLKTLQNSILEDEQATKIFSSDFKTFDLRETLFADQGCVSRVRFIDDGYVSSGASGEIKFWQNNLQKSSLIGHTNRVNDLQQLKNGLLVSGSSDTTIRVWNLSHNSEIGLFSGHKNRVNRILKIPFNNFLISTSHDCTWRIWDIDCGRELLLQTGHGAGVYTASLHPDSSLLFTGDLAGVGMCWDLRIGKAILPLLGHVGQVLSSDFHKNGYQLATGADDNTIRIWDLRRKNCLKTIPAHTKLVSHLLFASNQESSLLLSSSFDGTLRFWSPIDWTQSHLIEFQNSKITSFDISNDAGTIICSSQDRKLNILSNVKKDFMEIEYN